MWKFEDKLEVISKIKPPKREKSINKYSFEFKMNL